MSKKRTIIKNSKGIIIGYIDVDTQTGDKTARDMNGVILGFYNHRENYTKDFYGKILAIGDIISSLITDAYENKK